MAGSDSLKSKKYFFDKPVSIAPLITFRIVFGLLMMVSTIRFWYRGWITTVYVAPRFHFTYMGFEWVQPLGSVGMHILFLVIILSAFHIMLGFFYRVSAVIFFLTFTYAELIDVTTYLNHYYFISLVAFMMIWLPAHCNYSVDARLKPTIRMRLVPACCVDMLRFQIAVVYVFAGLAKLNYDWLVNAEPMRIWLPAKTYLPIVGEYLYQTWVAYAFSWFGAMYDLFIVFFLFNKRTRAVAYLFVIIFHGATAIFFPEIGLFPYVMILFSLVFFSGDFHEKLLSFLPYYKKTIHSNENDHPHWFQLMYVRLDKITKKRKKLYRFPKERKWIKLWGIGIYMFVQIMIPLRFLCYPGHLFWTEEGYRFSWRVMLMEKSGIAYFTVKDKMHTQSYEVNNAQYLTPLQEKMMSTQPDMILKYAHFLADQYEKEKSLPNPEVYGEIYVSLNGMRSALFIDSTVNLAAQRLSWKHYKWIMPYKK